MAEDIPAVPDRGEAELENKPEHPRDAKPWKKMIEHANRVFDKYTTICDNLQKEYANAAQLTKVGGERQYQMLYANLEVVKPSIYSRAPQPVVVPRFKDRKPVARKTSEMLERALVSSFDTEKVHQTLLHARDDLALFGRGVVWARYETYDKAGEPKECVRYDWIYRKDFLHEPARTWSEVGWVARGTWLTKEQGEERFGKEWGKNVQYLDASDTSDDYKVEQKARVWEIWDRTQNVVVWIHPNSEDVLDIAEPHLKLEGFFPCSKPAFGTLEPGTLIPVPDPCFYKDQLEEINELTARISALSESLKLVGFYAAGVEDLGDAIATALKIAEKDNRRIAVPLAGMSQFGAGALKDAIVWLPVDMVATTVMQLIALRKQLKEDVYEIGGVSDIMRGSTEASETLGAQQLKSQYGSIRIKDRQSEMIHLADGMLNIAGEIMAENFSPETLMEMSQTELPKQADILAQHQQAMQQEIQQAIQQAQQAMAQGQPPPDPQQIEQAKQQLIEKHQKEVAEVVTVEQVFGMLTSQKVRPFILQIATDSTIQPDENAEKAARSEFGAAFAQATTAMGPLVQTAPAESADFVGEMLKFMMAPFRAGRPMEQAIDDFVEKMKERAKAPPPPNPEMLKMEQEGKRMEAETAAKAAEMEDRKAERDGKQSMMMADANAKQQERAEAAADRAAERQHKKEMADSQTLMKQMDVRLKEIELSLKQIAAATGESDGKAKLDHDRAKHIDVMNLEREKLDLERYAVEQKDRDIEERGKIEGDKRQHDMTMKDREYERAEQSKASSKAEVGDDDGEEEAKSERGMDAIGRGLEALAAVLGKPKTIIRGKDGRALGVE